jgi:hypothetical protein
LVHAITIIPHPEQRQGEAVARVEGRTVLMQRSGGLRLVTRGARRLISPGRRSKASTRWAASLCVVGQQLRDAAAQGVVDQCPQASAAQSALPCEFGSDIAVEHQNSSHTPELI